MKRFVRFMLVAIAIVAVAGVASAGGTKEGAGPAKKLVIAFSPGVTTNPFYVAMQYGAVTAAKKYNVSLIWQGSQQWDFNQQSVVLQSMLTQKPDALILSPTDPDALKPLLQQAVSQGALVITTDTDINDPTFAIRKQWIGSDNVKGGQMAGEALAKALNGKGDVALMGSLVGVTTNEDRYKGFKDALAKYPDIKIVTTQYSNDDQATAASQMQSVLLSNPNLAGAFGVDTPTAHGDAVGIKNASMGGKVVLVGFDSQPLEVDDLKAGLITMLVTQGPYQMGYLAVENAYKYLTGQTKELQQKITTDMYVITSQNVNDPETAKWVYQTSLPSN